MLYRFIEDSSARNTLDDMELVISLVWFYLVAFVLFGLFLG